jgi:6-phosphogluconolactonase (cycloisomerase 2 family)
MMRTLLKVAVLATAVLGFAAPAMAAGNGGAGDAVYALTNAASGNGVVYYERAADGTLTWVATYATRGNGTGAGLGSQGSVALSDDGKLLFAVNAGSNSVSEFAVRKHGLRFLSAFPSNGTLPISVTVRRDTLYVLNAGSSAISGFKVEGAGRAEAIDGSTQPLLGTSPAQVAFSPDGSLLVVTEKGSRTLDTFRVDRKGRAQAGVSSPSAGATPFGFAFDGLGRAFVSEAAGSASSYTVDATGAHVISAAIATGQGAPCWLVVTPNGRFAYTANAGGGSISGFAIAADGSISLASTTPLGAGSHPLDESVSSNGQFLYVLVDGRHTVGAFRIGADGSLAPLGEVGTLPAGAVGLASS